MEPSKDDAATSVIVAESKRWDAQDSLLVPGELLIALPWTEARGLSAGAQQLN
jgi:hypothetical protein